MAVQWGIAQPQFNALDVLRTYGAAQQQKIAEQDRAIALRKAQRDEQQQAAQMAARQQVGGMAASGDLVGARNTALGLGDFDLAGAVGQMDAQQKTAAAARTAKLGEAVKWADTPEKWNQAVAVLSRDNPEIAQYAGQFDKREQFALQIGQISQLLTPETKPTNEIQNLMAAGIDPRSPEGREALLGHINPNKFMEFGSDATGRQLIQTGGMGVGGGASPQPSANGAQIEQIALSTVPGARVTSGLRTPEHNREVGGARNSYHLTGQARDLVPPRGVSMAQFAGQIRQALPGMEVINEGDHVHVEPASRRGGGPRVLASTGPAPKERYEILAPREARSLGLDPAGTYQRSPSGQITAVREPKNSEGGVDRKAETDLRKEFQGQPEVKNFKLQRTSMQQIRALANRPSAQNDIALVFSYMKMLDPTSVVREGEFATAQNAAGVPERVRNQYNKARNGEFLSRDQRQGIVRSAEEVYIPARRGYNDTAVRFQGLARDYGLSPRRIAPRAIPGPSGGNNRGAAVSPTIRRIG